MITVESTGTADDNDFLSGSDLDNIPEGGLLVVNIASTQDDTLIEITGPGGAPVVRNQAAVLRANAEIALDDPDFVVGVSQGGHYIIAVNVQTAATFRVRAIYIPADELAAMMG